MTALATTSDVVSAIDADALILGILDGGELTAHAQLPEDVRAAITASASALEPSAKVGSVTVFVHPSVAARRVVLVGVGGGTDGDLREAAGAAARACGKEPKRVVLALPALTSAAQAAVGEGAILGAYRFTSYLSSEASDDAYDGAEWIVAGADEAAINRAKIIAGAVAGTRDLVNTAPLDLYPASFAEEAGELGHRAGLAVKVWEPQDLADEGFGGILAVGMGSSRLPRLVRVEYKPKGAKETVALVGKGITFDSGGISLKQNDGMQTMKSDMAGAAAVLHILIAASRLELPIAVTGWLCLAENMPSGTAQRPSDVIRIHGGKSVEVLNTDAEGRLVLADGLDRACEDEPAVVIDIATLTGAQGLALGSRTSAVMGTPKVRDAVLAAANEVVELMWAMPLPEHLRESLESKVADLKNTGDRQGGMLSAGLFLREFAGTTPWAHLDIARPAFNEGSAYGFTPPGGTGAAVRTVIRFLENRTGA
jgi:leucyl aminopeptidase